MFIFLVSCTMSHYAQLREDFNKEKPSFWKFDEKKNLYSTTITDIGDNENGVLLWKKYKDYLIGKDTLFILKEFGMPNFKDKNKRSYKYFINVNCDFLYDKTKEEPENYSCSIIDFIFDENYKLKKVSPIVFGVRTQD